MHTQIKNQVFLSYPSVAEELEHCNPAGF